MKVLRLIILFSTVFYANAFAQSGLFGRHFSIAFTPGTAINASQPNANLNSGLTSLTLFWEGSFEFNYSRSKSLLLQFSSSKTATYGPDFYLFDLGPQYPFDPFSSVSGWEFGSGTAKQLSIKEIGLAWRSFTKNGSGGAGPVGFYQQLGLNYVQYSFIDPISSNYASISEDNLKPVPGLHLSYSIGEAILISRHLLFDFSMTTGFYYCRGAFASKDEFPFLDAGKTYYYETFNYKGNETNQLQLNMESEASKRLLGYGAFRINLGLRYFIF